MVQGSRRKALLIGADDYPEQWADTYPPLRSPATDLALMAYVLGLPHVGYDVLEPLYNTGLAKIQTEIERFMRGASGEDRLLYLTGHGDVDNGSYYFVPARTEPGFLKSAGLSENFLKSVLASYPAKSKIAIVDTCHAGQMARFSAKGSGSGVSAPPAYPMLRGEGTSLMCATAPDQKAFERKDPDDSEKNYYSLFTSAIAFGIREGKGMDEAGEIKPGPLTAFAEHAIKSYRTDFSELTDRPQVPMHTVWAERFGGPSLASRPADFPFTMDSGSPVTFFDRMRKFRGWSVPDEPPEAVPAQIGEALTDVGEQVYQDHNRVEKINEWASDRAARRAELIQKFVIPGIGKPIIGPDRLPKQWRHTFEQNVRAEGYNAAQIERLTAEVIQLRLMVADGAYYCVKPELLRRREAP